MVTAVVVESDRTQQLILSKILKKVGLNVIFAGDGFEVLELVQSHCPELVVLDRIMPQIDGYEVCRLLKSNEKTVKKPVVLIFCHKISGRNFYSGSKQGADAYLSRLCRPQELVDTVKRLLQQQEAVFQA